jgi:4-alpha-glucanotransferase
VADFAVVPFQDVLRLGTEARMNVPGVPSGNWHWRCTEEMLRSDVWNQLGDLTELYYRQPGPDERE